MEAREETCSVHDDAHSFTLPPCTGPAVDMLSASCCSPFSYLCAHLWKMKCSCGLSPTLWASETVARGPLTSSASLSRSPAVQGMVVRYLLHLLSSCGDLGFLTLYIFFFIQNKTIFSTLKKEKKKKKSQMFCAFLRQHCVPGCILGLNMEIPESELVYLESYS